MSLFLKKGERGFICGQSGSGKSVAACWLLQRAPLPLVIFDTKISPTLPAAFPHAKVYDAISGWNLSLKNKVAIVRPDPDELYDRKYMDSALYGLYEAKRGMTVYLDEAADFHNDAGRAGRGLLALVSRGREQGVTLLAGTQRPARIDPYLISEANHSYIFSLKTDKDRKRVEEWTSNTLDEIPRHHFVHIDVNGKSDFYAPVPLTIPATLRDRFKPKEKSLWG